MVDLFRGVVADLLSPGMPTIAAVTGHAAAAGLILAMSHDYIAMTSSRGAAALAAKVEAEGAVKMGIVDSAYDRVGDAIRKGEELAKKRWSGAAYWTER